MASKFLKRRLSSHNSSSSPSPTSPSSPSLNNNSSNASNSASPPPTVPMPHTPSSSIDASSGGGISSVKISSPLNPRYSPKSKVVSLPSESNGAISGPAIQPSISGASGTGSSSGTTGVIASTSNFFRNRAKSFSSGRGRSSSKDLTNNNPIPNVSSTNGNGSGNDNSRHTPPPPPIPNSAILSPVPNASTSSSTLVPYSPPPSTPPVQGSRNSTPRNQSRTRDRSDSQSHTPRSGSYRDISPGPLGPAPPNSARAMNREQSHGLGLPSNWWDKNKNDLILRSWRDCGTADEKEDEMKGKGKGKRKNTGDSGVGINVFSPTIESAGEASKEQAEGWDLTRQRVAIAARSILGTSLDLTHEALLLGVEFLDMAPVPGLQAAARTLLNVWDTLQQVDMNRMACLRLTQRCADILISVRQEVRDAGDDVADELKDPIAKLTDSFDQVYKFMLKQTDRPFLKRYLKRDEILKQIAGCDVSLSDSVSTFSLSIQIRILKQVQALSSRLASTPRFSDFNPPAYTYPIYNPPSDKTLGLGFEFAPRIDTTTRLHEISLDSPPTSPTSPAELTQAEIRAKLHAFRIRQNELDAGLDYVDLRQLMRAALQTSNDAQMIEVLQVGRDEMPEAIKTLQRALEREVEKESNSGGSAAGSLGNQNVVVPSTDTTKKAQSEGMPGTFVTSDDEAEGRRATVPGTSVGGATGLEKRTTTASTATGSGVTTQGSLSASGSGSWGRDTLDREFIESGIDALRRVSNGPDTSLPSWTITKYEVDLDQRIGKIGIGYFSTVYKGTWRRRTVAVKVLATTTPRKLFVKEIHIWKSLAHPNVLELYGASSAAGEPPWFFVSPYCHNGSLVTWLKGLNSVDDADLLRCMHQIAKGMEYLHKRGVLHGDLKAANVLVDDNRRCLVSDFGQSEMRSEAYRLSGTPPPHGTLRWQAPEMMGGVNNRLTQPMDVYAFAMCCVEALDKGTMPWQLLDDPAVIRFVLQDNKRPNLPRTRASSSALTALIHACWDRDPTLRPSFKKIAADLKQLRVGLGANAEEIESPRPWVPERTSELAPSRPSPDMRPIPLPFDPNAPPAVVGASPSTNGSYQTADEHSGTSMPEPIATESEEVRMPEPVLYTPSANTSRASSLFASSSSSLSDILEDTPAVFDGYDSPPPIDDRTAAARNERRYRLLLTHEFHPSLTLPLWTPSVIQLGSVGYLDKPSGAFITLFNAFDPEEIDVPSLYGYGRIPRGEQRNDKRNAAQRGLDALSGLLTFRSYSQNVTRRHSFPLRDGHKLAWLCTESTKYRYVEDLETPKKWFKSNVDAVMKHYGPKHHFTKEELFLIIGTLDAFEYALFVSHRHPDGQVHFNVFSSPRPGQFWGTFTTDTQHPAEVGGPSYHEQVPGNSQSASKVSMAGKPDLWTSVILARLRFKPDVAEPTSL